MMLALASAPPAAGASHSQDEEDEGRKQNGSREEEGKRDGLSCSHKRIPLCEVYSVASPSVTATGSNKFKEATPKINADDQFGDKPIALNSRETLVYSRRFKNRKNPSFHGMLNSSDLEGLCDDKRGVKRARIENRDELVKPAVCDKPSGKLDGEMQLSSGEITIRELRKKICSKKFLSAETWKPKKRIFRAENDPKSAGDGRRKTWKWLSFEDEDPTKFVGLDCKVLWPLDGVWYCGNVISYNSDTGRHLVRYEDGDEENLCFSNERIMFNVSLELMRSLKLKVRTRCSESDGLDIDELKILAASLDDSQEMDTGDVIWAKLAGHAVWPAIVMDESQVSKHKGLNKMSGEKTVLVQFFGSHDFARIKHKNAYSFCTGLVSLYHAKCSKPTFIRGMEEVRMYLNEQKLPERMLKLRDCDTDVNKCGSGEHQDGSDSSSRDCVSHDEMSKKNDLANRKSKCIPYGYRRVHVEWRDLDKCNVCHMDEEYESNLFLQCDKCRMMVHARCYGEPETTDDVLWLCKLCRPGAPETPPPCCLCPVVGGAMKPTTDGRWAHLACAIWIPETCLSDIKKMEPIDGLSRINKDRWKLVCSICNVSYGACIQCSNNNCRVSYHPLCARAAGFCLETENEDVHLIPVGDDEESQCIQLLSFCKKHGPLSAERLPDNEHDEKMIYDHSNYIPPENPSGCARTEPRDFLGKLQTNKSDVPAASLKRLYVENAPFLLGGCSPHMPLWDKSSDGPSLQKLQNSRLEPSYEILSVADKYNFMRKTFRKRLAFGKSRIHGFGVFTKFHIRAGDMVIEYTGELIRPVIADRREHMIYNSLVGAGTYMFRIDDKSVVDATRAGSIAQLINHSCEPNCYSRVISVNGDDHIIIFAKRDLRQWEELTYDYRFISSDEKLVCRCGSSRCRGVVNDTESEELAAKLRVPRSELTDWRGD